MERKVEIRTSDPKLAMTLDEVAQFVVDARAAGAPGDSPIVFENTVRSRSRAISTVVTGVDTPDQLETK